MQLSDLDTDSVSKAKDNQPRYGLVIFSLVQVTARGQKRLKEQKSQQSTSEMKSTTSAIQVILDCRCCFSLFIFCWLFVLH